MALNSGARGPEQAPDRVGGWNRERGLEVAPQPLLLRAAWESRCVRHGVEQRCARARAGPRSSRGLETGTGAGGCPPQPLFLRGAWESRCVWDGVEQRCARGRAGPPSSRGLETGSGGWWLLCGLGTGAGDGWLARLALPIPLVGSLCEDLLVGQPGGELDFSVVGKPADSLVQTVATLVASGEDESAATDVGA